MQQHQFTLCARIPTEHTLMEVPMSPFAKIAAGLCLALIQSIASAQVNSVTIQVNFTSAELTILRGGVQTPLLQTPVVLPRGNYYPVPVSGTVRQAILGPRWTPTAKMHRDHPGRYKRSYAPYEKGNAMGACKLIIDFNSRVPIMQHVRIHGNAKTDDLGRRLSRSCIRIPDELCSTLVSYVQRFETVHVEFVR